MAKIPGPRSFPLIGTAWTYFPVVGCANVDKLHLTYKQNFFKYGELVREVIGGKNIVSIYNPFHIEAMFRNEGRWPVRISHEVLLSVRRENPRLYSSGGLVPSNGEEWGRLRTAYQKDISRPDTVSQYLGLLETTSQEFVAYVEASRSATDGGRIPDLLYKMHEWALENVCLTVLDTRLDTFQNPRKPICGKLIDAGNRLLAALGAAEYDPSWRYLRNRLYRDVMELDLFFYRFAEIHVRERLKTIQNTGAAPDKNVTKGSVLEKYLQNPGNELRDVIIMASDLIFAGLLTTAISMSFVLYHLARNPEKQELLYQEIREHLSDRFRTEANLSMDVIHRMHYLKACIRESLRLNPVSLGTSRVLPTDLQLSGYRVPAGSIILAQHQVASILPEYVDNPLRFLPERWLRHHPSDNGTLGNLKKPHPFLVLPFGTGPRACIGRRFAELEMYVFLILFVRRFRLEWAGPGDVDVMTRLLNVPERAMEIKAFVRED